MAFANNVMDLTLLRSATKMPSPRRPKGRPTSLLQKRERRRKKHEEGMSNNASNSNKGKQIAYGQPSKSPTSGYYICSGPHRSVNCLKRDKLGALIGETEGSNLEALAELIFYNCGMLSRPGRPQPRID